MSKKRQTKGERPGDGDELRLVTGGDRHEAVDTLCPGNVRRNWLLRIHNVALREDCACGIVDLDSVPRLAALGDCILPYLIDQSVSPMRACLIDQCTSTECEQANGIDRVLALERLVDRNGTESPDYFADIRMTRWRSG